MILTPKSAQGKSSRISHACRRISQNQENIAGEYRRVRQNNVAEYRLARRLVSAENRSQELANCVSTPLICKNFPQTPSSIGRAPFMRYVHKGCLRLTAHIVHEWINVSGISRISNFQSWQLCKMFKLSI